MLNRFIPAAILSAAIAPAMAADATYTKDVLPIFKDRCIECHGPDSPDLQTFDADDKRYIKEKTGPRMNSYAEVIYFIGWPDTGAIMRRLDDGKSAKDGKPGNMYRQLGSDEAERQKNLAVFKAWVGEGAWFLNRWKARGDVPAVTKEQLDKLQLKY